jgi:uncharacterized membrane protein
MSLLRIARHMLAPDWVAHRAFPAATLDAIAQAIAASERTHRGELRFAVEAGLDLLPLARGLSPRERALQVFSDLRVWDTEENSGVLVYVQLVDHAIEIVADRGIAARVSQAQWDAICRRMEGTFRERRYRDGALAAIDKISALLAGQFPARDANPNELPDRPVVL